MRFIYIYIVYTTVAFLTGSCVKPFDYQNIDYEKAIVVDGLITNEKKAHTIKLSYSSQIDVPENIPLTGASVWVDVSDGSTILLSEVEPGNYKTNIDVEAIPGNRYTLNFSLPDGKLYASTSETLSLPVAIDSIYTQYAELPSEVSGLNEQGIQFFIDSHDDTRNSKYFRYEWEGTYRIVTPYFTNYDFNYQTNSYVYRTDQVSLCYSTDYSNNLIVGNSLNNEFGKIVELPILFIPGESYKIRSRYSMLVKQYSISQEAYTYYKKLKESNETGGFLFDKQLGSIIGNIVNKQDPSESVLGFFEVSSVSEQRRFFNLRDLDNRIGLPPFKYECNFNEIINTTNDSISFYLNRDRSLRIINIAFMMNPAQLMSKQCTDCSWYATTTKPDFWID